MPIRVLQILDHLTGERDRLTTIYQIAAALHDHVSYNLLAVAELLYQVAQQRVEVDLKIDEVFLEE